MKYNPARDITPCTSAHENRDLCSEGGAHYLANKLDQWWHDYGYPQVSHHAIPLASTRLGALWGVRSNLVNGLPPRPIPDAAPRSRATGVVEEGAATPLASPTLARPLGLAVGEWLRERKA